MNIKKSLQLIENRVGKNIVYPINFCVPEELVLAEIPEKKKQFGTVIPGELSTYVFKDQNLYYKDYQDSYFGYTRKKGQWDTIRTQEIMMNACVPIFTDINNCPVGSLMHHDKDMLLEIRDRYLNRSFDLDMYNQDVSWCLEYCRNHLTTKAMAKYILDVTGTRDAKKILFITLGDRADHLNDFLFHGFRSLYGNDFIETNKLWWMYNGIEEGMTYRGTNSDRIRIDPNDPNLSKVDRDGLVPKKVKVNQLRGGGFTYSGHLDNIEIDRSNIEDKINEKYFDLIVYGSVHRCTDYLDLVLKNYDRNQVFFFDVDDDVVNTKYRPRAFEKYTSSGIYFCTDLTSIVDL